MQRSGAQRGLSKDDCCVKPNEICTHLGSEKIDACYGELSAQEIRAILKAGGVNTNTPSTAFTQAARRKVWRKRFDNEMAAENQQISLALLLEWLMRHHRYLLVDYLDLLEVPHDNGETEENFTETKSEEELLGAYRSLKEKHDKQNVAVYLLVMGLMQQCELFQRTLEVLEDLGMSGSDAERYIRELPAAE